ncbi:hypothetical protein GCM10010399_57120 [Dactylosporangium fulvum]
MTVSPAAYALGASTTVVAVATTAAPTAVAATIMVRLRRGARVRCDAGGVVPAEGINETPLLETVSPAGGVTGRPGVR